MLSLSCEKIYSPYYSHNPFLGKSTLTLNSHSRLDDSNLRSLDPEADAPPNEVPRQEFPLCFAIPSTQALPSFSSDTPTGFTEWFSAHRSSATLRSVDREIPA
jgi:hypothetical protein